MPITAAASTEVRPALGSARAPFHRLRRFGEGCAWLALFWAVAIFFQILSGAYRSEMNGYPDEPAHYITSLMLRDYLTSGQWAHPVRFAEDYYLHYPKVTFGVWGPGLQLLSASWMLIFSQSRTSILLLMALLPAGIATTLFYIARPRFSLPGALALSTLLIALPEVQWNTQRVMADNLLALMAIFAVLALARFLDTGQTRPAVLYAVFAVAGILTKGSGLAVLLAVPLAIAMLRRWDLLKTRAFWYIPLIVALGGGPWSYWSAGMLSRFISRHVGLDNAVSSFLGMVRIVGPFLFFFAAIGFWAMVAEPLVVNRRSQREKPLETIWAVMGALVIGEVAFHSLIPWSGIEARLLIAAAAPLLLFLAAGIAWLAERLPASIPLRWRAASLAAIVLFLFAGQTFAIPHKEHRGFMELAHDLLKPEHRDQIILVSSTGEGEGMLVSELAMQADHRPQNIVLRGTKMLSVSDWEGGHYHPLQRNPEEVMALLQSIPVAIVVVDLDSPHPDMTAHQMLRDTLSLYSDRWQRIGTYPAGANPTIEVYKLIGSEKLPRGKIHLNLPYTLGRSIDK